MKREVEKSLGSYLVEVVVYAVLMAGYYFLVLHFLGDWFYRLFQSDRRWYAGVGLGCVICQGVLLEALTRLLLSWIRPRMEK